MLGVLRGRPRLWLLTSLSLSYAHGLAAAPFGRLLRSPFLEERKLDRLSVPCPAAQYSGGAASVWHTILPSYWRRRQCAVFSRHENEAVKRAEGSWNVAWDARPARWLHHPDSAWLLFGTAPAIDFDLESQSEVLVPADESKTDNYRVTVAADGRCLFRAIAHMACLLNGEKAPDENRQRELADELRSQVVEELLSRRKEIEWFIDEEFDVYVKRIEQPYTWGGEPELLMCSHVLRTPICVFTKEKKSGNLVKTTYYGEEYRKEDGNSINVLFHGYGHYDILEAVGSS
ncbi:hypothetical protein ACS0TY_009578 [Phlomoides rotata]